MKRANRWLGLVIVLALQWCWPTHGLAQAGLVPDKKPEEVKKTEGWDFLLAPGASLSLSDNRSVVGQAEGLSMVMGANLAAGASFRAGTHELRNTLAVNELFSRTPVLEQFVKSADVLKFESIYLWHLIPWLGPFAQLGIDTGLLENFDRQPQRATWTIARADGTTDTHQGYELRLSDGFQPLTLKESAGMFAKPIEGPALNLEFRLGFGGLHVFADGALAIKNDAATPEIDVIGLKGFSQAGGVGDLAFYGEMLEKRVIYRVGVSLLTPFIREKAEGDDRSVAEMTNIEFNAMLSFKLLSWLSVDYVFRALRQPQLIDQFQVQNNLLVTASYAFFKPEEKK